MALNDEHRYVNTFDNVDAYEKRDEIRSWPSASGVTELKSDFIVAIDRAIAEREDALRSRVRSTYSRADIDPRWHPALSVVDGTYNSLTQNRYPQSVFMSFVDRLRTICTYFMNPGYDASQDDFGKAYKWTGRTVPKQVGGQTIENVFEYERTIVKTANNGSAKTNPFRMWTWGDLLKEEGCDVLAKLGPKWTYVTDREFGTWLASVYSAFRTVLSKLYAIPLTNCCYAAGRNTYSATGQSGVDPADLNPEGGRPKFTSESAAYADAVEGIGRAFAHQWESDEDEDKKRISGYFGKYKEGSGLGDSTRAVVGSWGWPYLISSSKYELRCTIKDTGKKRKDDPCGLHIGDLDDYDYDFPGVSAPLSWSYSGSWHKGYAYRGGNWDYSGWINTDSVSASASASISGSVVDFIAVRGCKGDKAPVLHYRVSNPFPDCLDPMPEEGEHTVFVDGEFVHDRAEGASSQGYFYASDDQNVVFRPYGQTTRDPKHFVEKTVQLSSTGKLASVICEGPAKPGDMSKMTPPALRALGDIHSWTRKYSDGDTQDYQSPVRSASSSFSGTVVAYRFWCDYSKVFDFM